MSELLFAPTQEEIYFSMFTCKSEQTSGEVSDNIDTRISLPSEVDDPSAYFVEEFVCYSNEDNRFMVDPVFAEQLTYDDDWWEYLFELSEKKNLGIYDVYCLHGFRQSVGEVVRNNLNTEYAETFDFVDWVMEIDKLGQLGRSEELIALLRNEDSPVERFSEERYKTLQHHILTNILNIFFATPIHIEKVFGRSCYDKLLPWLRDYYIELDSDPDFNEEDFNCLVLQKIHEDLSENMFINGVYVYYANIREKVIRLLRNLDVDRHERRRCYQNIKGFFCLPKPSQNFIFVSCKSIYVVEQEFTNLGSISLINQNVGDTFYPDIFSQHNGKDSMTRVELKKAGATFLTPAEIAEFYGWDLSYLECLSRYFNLNFVIWEFCHSHNEIKDYRRSDRCILVQWSSKAELIEIAVVEL